MSLLYYRQEEARHPEAHGARCDPTEAEIAIRKLARHFKVPVPSIRFTSGMRSSRAHSWRITLNRDALNWLLVCHEFAHTWDRHCPGFHRPRHHDKRHARLVDRAVRYCTRQGWVAGRIRESVEQKQARAAAREAMAARPLGTAERIAHKEVLMRHLERRVARLNTMIKKHRRSIVAIQAAERRAANRSTTKGEVQ